MRFVLLGPPGAGKGTLAALLKESLGFLPISTGDILREQIKNNTPIGLEAKKYIESGQLVPDEVVTKLVEEKFRKGDIKDQSFLLDGFPRTRKQAEDLDQILKSIGKPIDYAVYLTSSLTVVIKRLAGRRVCRNCGGLFHMINKRPLKEGICDQCGGNLYQREDDNEATIRTRMDVYIQNTQPVIDYYKAQGKLKTLDSDKEAPEVQNELMNFLNEDRKGHKHKI